MQAPMFVRPLTDRERAAVTAGLRSADSFRLRRCQMILASARGEHVPAIARSLGCSEQAVRNALQAFNVAGVEALTARPRRPRTDAAAFGPAQAEVQQGVPKEDPDPKALACYGLLRPGGEAKADQVWLRFVEGRPVSVQTIPFLSWSLCELARAGKKALLLVWDNASWHISRAVREW